MSLQILTPQELENLLTIRPTVTETAGNGGLGSPFLRLLATAGRELLSQLMTEQHYKPGQILFQEGEVGDTMYIIWSGRVAVVKGDWQAPAVLGYRGVGEFIGEMALLESQPRSASVVALENVRALQIRRDDFEKLLNTNPAMGLSILGTLSARLRAADDARKASMRLENQLTQQVSALQTEKQKLLELERLRQDTIDLIVHDLRHPISSIFGAIKILEMVLPEEVLRANQQLLNIANLNCDQLQIMVDSLLDVARMESGDEQLKLSSTNLQQVVMDTIKRVNIVADMENVTLQPIFPDDLPLINADEEKLGRVLVNLVNNAIKYSPSGSQVVITVKVQDDQVITKIIDNGPGIPPKDRKKIFDRFAQLSSGATRSSGFGLGLAFCQLAIEAHGGRIWVESGDEGVGSQFIFSLPLPQTTRP